MNLETISLKVRIVNGLSHVASNVLKNVRLTLTPTTVATRINCGLRGSTHSSFMPVLKPTSERGLKVLGGTAEDPVCAK